ncbi:MAG: protein kinase [Phycisphaerales bacterium]|nr:protein kinase [Phycisphaerales bacterium]
MTTQGDRHEDLYDAYLEAALEGRAEDPAEFLRRNQIPEGPLADALRRVHAEASQAAVADARAAVARRIGPFEIVRLLGRGGMGEVYLAKQDSLGRLVALKIIHGAHASSPSALARFEREARAAAKLRHAGIVTVYEVGEAEGVHYIAMEYVRGRSLDAVLAERAARGESVPAASVVRWGVQLAEALDSAHAERIVHRDIKPSNILITPDDRPMLLDFGLARDLEQAGATLTEAFVGSPHYAAPEQVGRRGGHIDARTDIYSLGVVLYQAAAGVKPFRGETLEQVLHAILTDDPPEARRINAGIPQDLSVVIAKAMDREPARRYASAAALAADLRAIEESRPVSARPISPVGRALRWSRRNRGASAAILTGACAVALALGLRGWRVWAEAAHRRQEILSALSEAADFVGRYRSEGESTRTLEAEYEALIAQRSSMYFSPERDERIDAIEGHVRQERERRDLAFYRVLELAARAERLGADHTRVDRIRGELYLQRYLEAEIRADAPAKAVYAELVRAHDTDDTLTERLVGSTSLAVACDTPGAECFLFRRESASFLRDGAEPRLVNLPFAGDAPQRPDEWALEVQADAGGLHAGDVITRVAGLPIRGTVLVLFAPAAPERPSRFDRLAAIDGRPIADPFDVRDAESHPGVHTYAFEGKDGPLSLRGESLDSLGIGVGDPRAACAAGGANLLAWVGDAWRATTFERGIDTRPAAAPVYFCPGASFPNDPQQRRVLTPGHYLLVVRAPGFESQRLALELGRDQALHLTPRLLPRGSTPDGWVYIPPAPGGATEGPAGPDGFWAMEHEVTVGDYFAFLNQPEILAELDASGATRLHPFASEEVPALRAPDGSFAIPLNWRRDWPIFAISWDDASRYARWMSDHDPLGASYTLPTLDEHLRMTSVAARYVFGDEFRPKWVSSNFARPAPTLEPVESFPIDRSALGVFDLAGSVSEWLDHVWLESSGAKEHAGGAWGLGEEGYFANYGGNGLLPYQRNGVVGFRLVMRRDGESR